MAAPNIISATSIYGKTTAAALDTTTTTSLLANAASSNKLLKLNSIIVANKDGSSAADVTISWYNASTGFYVASTVSVPAPSPLVVFGTDSPFYLDQRQSGSCEASCGGGLDVLICYEEPVAA